MLAQVAAENGADHIVISSPHTDVLVLLLHHRPAISASEVFFFTGREGKHADLTRYILSIKYMIALRPANSTFYCLFTALQVATPSVRSGGMARRLCTD